MGPPATSIGMRVGRRSVPAAIVAAFTLGVVPATASLSPTGCNAIGLDLHLQRVPASVIPGGTVSYFVSAANLSSYSAITCDADDLDVVFYCPGADGNPNYAHPQVLTTSLHLPSNTAPTAVGAPRCTLNVNEGVLDAIAEVRLGDQTGDIDSLVQGRFHDNDIVDDPVREIYQIGTEVVTTTTSTSTSNTAVTLTTSSSTTIMTTSSTSTTSTMPPGCACDPGPPGSPNRDCCSPSCEVIESRIGLACGTAMPDLCELGDICSTDGRCQPNIIPADPPTICRNAFTNGPCDHGDVCDGTSPKCPTTGDIPCLNVPEPPPMATEFVVNCARSNEGQLTLECSAVGRTAASATAVRHAGVTRDAEQCEPGGRILAKRVFATFEQSMDKRFLQSQVKLRLNAFGQRILNDAGSLNVCVLIKITSDGKKGKILTTQKQSVILTR